MQPTNIALAPDLNLSTEDFVTAWNQNTDCRAMAQAQAGGSPPGQFEPLSATTIALLGGIATSLATNALYDFIKQVLIAKGITQKNRHERGDLAGWYPTGRRETRK